MTESFLHIKALEHIIDKIEIECCASDYSYAFIEKEKEFIQLAPKFIFTEKLLKIDLVYSEKDNCFFLINLADETLRKYFGAIHRHMWSLEKECMVTIRIDKKHSEDISDDDSLFGLVGCTKNISFSSGITNTTDVFHHSCMLKFRMK